jgi:serine/threonine protein kinase/Tol biopolymer transport system component
MEAAPSANAVGFGPFRLDLKAGELHKDGHRIRLQEQPFQVLKMLLERPGEIVTREAIRQKLWPNDTIVEFDHSINAAIKKLRSALGDSAEEPRFVETVARRGYRLLVLAEREEAKSAGPTATAETPSESDSETENLIGKRVSHYRILGLLGGGGMGVVYRAEDLKLGRRVALKFLPEELGNDAKSLKRFEGEARAASSLDHPNICTIYEFGEHEHQPFIVMQLLEGETLRDRIARVGALPILELLDVAIQIAHGLGTAHEKGIIHRDIKPANIFVTSQGQAKILDFGLAKFAERDDSPSNSEKGVCAEGPTSIPPAGLIAEGALSRTGVAMGTAAYMSPEQVRGEKLDARTDLFSFGLVLYEMVTGRQAFAGETLAQLHAAILNQTPISASQLSAQATPELEAIISQALEKDREKRYQRASDFRADLEGLYRTHTASAPRSDRPTHHEGVPGTHGAGDLAYSSQSRLRRRVGYCVLATFILAAVGLVGFRLTPLPPPKVLGITPITNDGQKKGPFVTDGSRLYITENVDNQRSLVQVSVTGGETVPFSISLPNPGIDDIFPDGTALFVKSGAAGLVPSPSSYWIVPLPGGSPRRLGEIRSHDVHPSPDGQQIAYFEESDLYLAQADGTRPRKLLTVPGKGPGWASWAPDGSKLRFDMDDPRSGTHSIWEVASDGSNLHPLLPGSNQGLQCCGRWTPDGRYFVFQISRNRVTHQLWAIREEGSLWRRVSRDPVQLTNGPMQFRAPVPTKDGKRIFAIGGQVRSEIIRYAKQSQEWVPYHSGKSMVGLDFSKDGQWVAYVAHPEDTLWRSRKDFGDPQQLTFPHLKVENPRWSPDGNQISFQGKAPGKPWKIYVVSRSGGNSQQLTFGDRDETFPDWSPDGSKLAFGGPYHFQPETSEGPRPIQLVDLETNELSVLPGSEGFFGPRWSPDGRYLVARRFALDGLMLFDFTTQKWEELAKGSCGLVNWSRDGQYIYFVRRDDKDDAAVRIGIHNRKEVRIVSVKAFMDQTRTWLGLAPDDSLLMLRDIGSGEIYALDWEAP